MNNPNINKRPLVLGLRPNGKSPLDCGRNLNLAGRVGLCVFHYTFRGGTVDVYDFGTVGGEIIGTQPAFVVISSFTMKPGDRFRALPQGITYVMSRLAQ